MQLPKIGITVLWTDRKKGVGIGRGKVLSIRTTKTGRVWVQVQVIPYKEGDYSGQKSIRATKIVTRKGVQDSVLP